MSQRQGQNSPRGARAGLQERKHSLGVYMESKLHLKVHLLFPTPTSIILSCATLDRSLPLSEPACLAGKCQ